MIWGYKVSLSPQIKHNKFNMIQKLNKIKKTKLIKIMHFH